MDWNALVAELSNAYKIEMTGANPGISNAQAESAHYNPHKEYRTKLGNCANFNFRVQDVEPLLDQSIAILDRALMDRTTLQNLGEKYANLKLELFQYLAIDDITQKEENCGITQDPNDPTKLIKGRYDVDAIVSRSNEQANLDTEAALEAVFSINGEQLDHVQGAPSQQEIDRAAGIAFVRAMYSDRQWKQKVKERTVFGGKTFEIENSSIVDADKDLTEDQRRYELRSESLAVQATRSELFGRRAATASTAEGLKAQRVWTEKNAGFLRERAEATRQAMRMKAALTVLGDLLDFRTQMDVVGQRYLEQLNDAHIRLEKVNDGLKQLYDYKKPDGKPDLLPPITEELRSFDEILSWTRRAAAWLAAFTRRCHNYVLPISVKRQTREDWDRGWKNGEGKWTFKLGEDLFEKYERHVRIRGMSAVVVGKEGPYTMNLTLPSTSMIQYEDGRTLEPFEQKHDTGAPLRCRLGRVVQRTGVTPEVSGLTMLFNASPFGEWNVTVSSKAISDSKLPDDFQIDLYLSVLTI
jgi:hypothetical protein